MLRAFLDTCVLFKPILCDTLLSIAEDEAFRPLWSHDVLGELDRNLVARGVPRTGVARRIEHMRRHFPEADVSDYDHLIPSLGNQSKDRHVLAAAIRGDAEVIVTENLRDFPAESLRAHAIEVAHQDEFLEDLLDLQPNIILNALARQASRYRCDPRTVEDLLITLGNRGNGCPRLRQELPRVPGLTEETARELSALFPVGAAAGERYYPEGLARVDR